MAKRASLTSLQGLVSSKGTTEPVETGHPEPQAPSVKTAKRSPNLFVEVNDEAKAALKILAIERGTTVKALMHEFINDGFRKYGKPPLAG